jgi:transaldolase
VKIAVYADGANRNDILKRHKEGLVKGFTTNPSLMVKAGITDYAGFAESILKEVTDMPFSFEVFSDEFPEMERQAIKIGAYGKNVYVKIPISNTKGESALPLCRKLLDRGLKLNVTAILTDAQVQALHETVKPTDDVIVSIFAGRIADTGVDPIPMMERAVALYRDKPGCKILWASTREVLNVYQAEWAGCHIITVTDDVISKLALKGKNLESYSLDTVKMFYQDALKAGFHI